MAAAAAGADVVLSADEDVMRVVIRPAGHCTASVPADMSLEHCEGE